MANTKAKTTKKKTTLAQDVAGIKERQKRNEVIADERQEKNDAAFLAGSEKMATLATKDDLATMQLEMATKADVQSLHALMFDLEGNPLFATRADVMPVVDFYTKARLASQLVNGGGKWFSRFIIVTVAFMVACGTLWLFFKNFILYTIHH